MSKHEDATGLIWWSVWGEMFRIQAWDLFIYSWIQCVSSTVLKMTQRDWAKERSKGNGFVQTNTWHKVSQTVSPCAEVVDPLKYFTEIHACSNINTEQSKSAPQVVPAEAGTWWNLLILKCMCAYLPYTQHLSIIIIFLS